MLRYGIYSEPCGCAFARGFITSRGHVDEAMHQCNVEAYYNQNITHIVIDNIRQEIVYECEYTHNFYYSMDKGRTWIKISHDDIEEILSI